MIVDNVMAKHTLVVIFFLLLRDDVSWDARLVLWHLETKIDFLSTNSIVVKVVLELVPETLQCGK